MTRVGRSATTADMGLEKVGVQCDNNGFIIGNYDGDAERTSIANIYAIGDVLQVCDNATYRRNKSFIKVFKANCGQVLSPALLIRPIAES